VSHRQSVLSLEVDPMSLGRLEMNSIPMNNGNIATTPEVLDGLVVIALSY
jgi:hypothetical protein